MEMEKIYYKARVVAYIAGGILVFIASVIWGFGYTFEAELNPIAIREEIEKEMPKPELEEEIILPEFVEWGKILEGEMSESSTIRDRDRD